MSDIGVWIERCCRRLNRGVALKVIAEWLAVWLCVFGTLVLAVKIGLPAAWPGVLWFAATLPALLWMSAKQARSDRFVATDGAALLDGRLRAGGLLMTVAERPNGDWQQALPRDPVVWEAALPRMRPTRFFRIVTLPVLFVAVAFAVPARAIPVDRSQIKRPSLQSVAELPEMLTALKKADVLDAEESEYLQREIEKIVESTAKSPPTAEHWRKIDALRARLRQRLETQIRTVEKGRNAARRLAQANQKGRPPLTKEQREQLEKDLTAALKRLAKQGKKTSKTSAAPVGKTANKSGLPRTITKSPNAKSGTGSKTAKSSTTKSQSSKSSGGKTAAQIAKTKTQTAKTGASKTGVHKTGSKKAAGGKTGSTKSTAAQKTSTSKTGMAIPKSIAIPKLAKSKLRPKSASAPKSGKSAKQAAGKQPGAGMPDLKKLLDMASKLPPEAQQELMKMAMSGKFSMPKNPAAREMLIKQVQKMLEQESGQLEQLQKQFAKLTGGALRPEDLRIPPGLEKMIPDGWNPPDGAGRNPKSGVKNATASNNVSPKKRAAQFRNVILPPGLLDKPRTDIDHLTGRTPEVNPVRPTTDPPVKPTGIPNGTAGGESWKRTVRPRHRRLVGEYFRSESKKKK